MIKIKAKWIRRFGSTKYIDRLILTSSCYSDATISPAMMKNTPKIRLISQIIVEDSV